MYMWSYNYLPFFTYNPTALTLIIEILIPLSPILFAILSPFTRSPPPPPGGGILPLWKVGGDVPLDRVWFFTVINIDTGYLNRPKWLLTGYSAYHRVAFRASQPTMFMTGPRSRHQQRCVACGTHWGGTQQISSFHFFLLQNINRDRVYIRGVQYCNRVCIWKFLVRVYCDRVYFFVRRAVWDRVRFWPPPPPPSGTPYPVEIWVPQPPPPPPPTRSVRSALTPDLDTPFPRFLFIIYGLQWKWPLRIISVKSTDKNKVVLSNDILTFT